MNRYLPNPPPNVPKEVQDFARAVWTELARISEVANALADGHLDKVNVAPAKAQEGDIRYADGTNWNPGSGQGLYQYRSGVWTFIGGGGGGSGTVTSVTAGDGLTATPNPIIAAGTISVAFSTWARIFSAMGS